MFVSWISIEHRNIFFIYLFNLFHIIYFGINGFLANTLKYQQENLIP